jgi:hypothetical protein
VSSSLALEWTATSSELKNVTLFAHVAFTQGDEDSPTVRVAGRGVHSSTFQLNLSRL